MQARGVVPLHAEVRRIGSLLAGLAEGLGSGVFSNERFRTYSSSAIRRIPPFHHTEVFGMYKPLRFN